MAVERLNICMQKYITGLSINKPNSEIILQCGVTLTGNRLKSHKSQM